MERYRIFFVYRLKDLNYIHVHGMDMEEKKLFTLLVESPSDEMNLSAHLGQFPQELLAVLTKEQDKINRGDYDLRNWEPSNYMSS